MELSKMRADVQSTMELMKQQWKELDSCLEDSVLGSEILGGNLIASRNLRLENEITLKENEFEYRERERQKAFEQKQKMFNQRSLDLDWKEDVLAIRRNILCSEHEEIKRMESELPLEEEKLKDLEQILKLDTLTFERESVFPGGIERKRNRSTMPESSEQSEADEGAKLGESSSRKRGRAQSSGSVRDDQQAMDPGENGLMFMLIMSPSHEIGGYMKVPKYFCVAYDLGGKKNVILSTDEGSFHLGVKHNISSSRTPTVKFSKGWKAFYRNNHLSVGSRCLFKLKEHVVNGDASTFSMEVSVFRH